MKNRTVVTPVSLTADFSKDGKLSYWKQVLPQAPIHYTAKSGKRASIDFDEKYLADLTAAFKQGAIGSVPFVLADKDNAHTMDPERIRGNVVDMRLAVPGEKPGLYAKIEFPSKQAAKAVLNYPDLPVSARIREGIETSDGKTFPAGIVHVCGTADPQVIGMQSWQAADLASGYTDDNVLDLSSAQYSNDEEAPMPKKKNAPKNAFADRELTSFTDAEIDAMSDELFDEFSARFPELNAVLPDDEPEDETDEPEDETDEELAPRKLVGAGASLSAKDKNDIELANASAASAHARAAALEARVADAEFREYRTLQLAAGVPPHVLDLAEPILNRAEDMVIDLSNGSGDDDDLNVAELVRQLVEGHQGEVDLSAEAGHNGVIGDEQDPDREVLELWNAQY